MFAVFGAGGQKLYNLADDRQSAAALQAPEAKSSWINSRWSPVRSLSDDEYGAMLQEKLLRIDAEIAIVDERIAAVREQEKAPREEEGEK